jgi:hypothetical protein
MGTAHPMDEPDKKSVLAVYSEAASSPPTSEEPINQGFL